jgi:tetratricopeptide (TPR) repeat protein
MTIPRVRLLVVLLFSLATSAAARADDDTNYKSLTAAAVEEHGLGHYEEARALFAKAHAIDPNARTLWGMGVAAFEARQYVDAIGLLEAALKEQRKPLTSAQRKQAESLLERSRDFVVRLPLHVEPRNAQVTIDGRVIQPDPDNPVLLDAGTHQIVISAPGYEELTRSMRWSAGDAPAWDVQLEPKQSGQVAQAEGAVSPAHAGAQTTPGRKGSSSAFTALKWASLGGTVAALGIMGAGIGLRESAAKEWNDDAKCPDDKNDSCPETKAAAKKWTTMAIAGGAATGVFATLAVVFFVLDRQPRGERALARAHCEPAFALGLTCQARF